MCLLARMPLMSFAYNQPTRLKRIYVSALHSPYPVITPFDTGPFIIQV